MDKEAKVCDLCPLKRLIIVAKMFEVNSNDVSLDICNSVTWGCSPNLNPLTTSRIDDKAERAVLTGEYSQVDFLKYRVKNPAPRVTSALSGCSPFSEQKRNYHLKCGAYCFIVPSNQDFIIRSSTPLDKLNCLPKFFLTPNMSSVPDS